MLHLYLFSVELKFLGVLFLIPQVRFQSQYKITITLICMFVIMTKSYRFF